MVRPTIPTYSSPENAVFHPVFKRAAEEALIAKGLSQQLEIIGQFPSPTGPIDFVFFDRATQKVVLPVEIKRTPSSVRGLGRRQARDYWSNLGVQCQTPFYCSTNLELTELFRYDHARPKTSSQRIDLKNAHSGAFDTTNEAVFYNNLIECIGELLGIVLGSLGYEYAVGLSQFQANIEASVNDHSKWHQFFIPACFEYIRGASTDSHNLKNSTSNWRQAGFYSSNPNRLIQLGKSIDFGHVFCEPAPNPSDPDSFNNAVLIEAFDSGKALGNGDDIAELVNEALAPSGLGIVETDAELSQLMAVFARAVLGREIESHEIAMDPGSGSGRLLTALPIAAFPHLMPNQVWANEKEIQFSEALSLRLGLSFANVLTPNAVPRITIGNIEDANVEDFANVKLIVMNPPFISGVQSVEIKRKFLNRIREVSGEESCINEGQIALEALFVELITSFAANETIVASIFPAQHFFRLSDEAVKLRRFLASKFSLTHIVFYPSRGVFQGVTKQTVLIVGVKGCVDPEVSLVEIQTQVGEVDFSQLMAGLLAGSQSPAHGVSVSSIPRSELVSSSTDGWKSLIGSGKRAQAYIDSYFNSYKKIGELPAKQVRRGTVGNGGNTKLTVFSLSKPHFPDVIALIPKSWLRPMLNTTDDMPRELTATNAPEMTFMPPATAFEAGSTENLMLRKIVDLYLAQPHKTEGKQVKKVHTQAEVIKKLKSDQKDFGSGWVLIQRASRTRGEISTLESDSVLLSTNVPMVQINTLRERRLLASWLLSVFGQLQLEQFGTPQEGMRKLEMGSVKQVGYPDFSTIPTNIEATLMSNFSHEPALSFTCVTARPSDYLWAQVVDPINPHECLDRALLVIQELIDERRGFGNS